MEEKPDNISILNTVSMCFNTSMNYSEFKMRLDIFGLDENDSVSALKRAHWFSRFCRYYSIDDFTFEIAFKKRDEPIVVGNGLPRSKMVLPSSFGTTIRKDTFTPELTLIAFGAGGKKISVSGNADLVEDMEAIHGLDMISETFNMLMYEIGAEMYPESRAGI